MTKSKSTDLPSSQSVADLAQFFDTHDMGDYWQEMAEANFDVDIVSTKHLVAIDAHLLDRLNEIARSKQVSAEALIDAWLREKAG